MYHSEEQLEKINSQLSQLQVSLNTLNSSNSQVILSPTNHSRDPLQSPTIRPIPTSGSSPNDQAEAHYLGGSSFEVHSQQTGQIFNETLQNSPASFMNQVMPSTVNDIVKTGKNGAENYMCVIPECLFPSHPRLFRAMS